MGKDLFGPRAEPKWRASQDRRLPYMTLKSTAILARTPFPKLKFWEIDERHIPVDAHWASRITFLKAASTQLSLKERTRDVETNPSIGRLALIKETLHEHVFANVLYLCCRHCLSLCNDVELCVRYSIRTKSWLMDCDGWGYCLLGWVFDSGGVVDNLTLTHVARRKALYWAWN
jgi:hypothetical protein